MRGDPRRLATLLSEDASKCPLRRLPRGALSMTSGCALDLSGGEAELNDGGPATTDENLVPEADAAGLKAAPPLPETREPPQGRGAASRRGTAQGRDGPRRITVRRDRSRRATERLRELRHPVCRGAARRRSSPSLRRNGVVPGRLR